MKFNKAAAWIMTLVISSPAYAWHDETHLAVAKAAGYRKWYNAAGADIAKEKAGNKEGHNHYYDAETDELITPQVVLDQASRYDEANDEKGHLYGAIIASSHRYLEKENSDKYKEYHLAYCAHYLGDLSQPLHNSGYDDFNKQHHAHNDGVVEKEALASIGKIRKRMYEIVIRPQAFEHDLAREVARIANLSHWLAIRMKGQDRDMTKEEAYVQLGHSASLLQAVLRAISKGATPNVSPAKGAPVSDKESSAPGGSAARKPLPMAWSR